MLFVALSCLPDSFCAQFEFFTSPPPRRPSRPAEGARLASSAPLQAMSPIHIAFAVVGLTLGLYAGRSASPVVGSLITGVCGLLSGGVLVVFLVRKVGDQPVVDTTAAPAIDNG